MTKAIMAASFDPITNGHVDLANRAARIFETVIVAVYESPKKNLLFDTPNRVRMASEALHHPENVEVTSYTGLLVEYAESVGANILVRGLRAISDFDYEFQFASMNRKINASIEVVFFLADIRYTFLSSSIVKEIAELGGDVSDLVPQGVARSLRARFQAGEA